MRNLDGKVAIVTGGASGIGFGMVRAFLAEGMKVAILDYNEAHLAEARAALAGSNAVHFIRVDVSDRAQVRAAADEVLAAFGKIHILCNNAGVAGGGRAADEDFDAWDHAVGINFGGVVNGTKIIVPIIRAQGEGGHVVNTASMAGMVPLPGFGAYMAAKYAVRGFSEALRMDLAAEGIGVSCLYPGATKSNLAPVPDDDSEEADEFTKSFWAAMRAAMDPADLGRMVVDAIRDNRFHILTHREFLAEVQHRHHTIEEAFVEGEEIPEARSTFENSRREAVERLFDMPAKD